MLDPQIVTYSSPLRPQRCFAVTVDGVTRTPQNYARPMFQVFADGRSLTRTQWRYLPGEPIDEKVWLENGTIVTVGGERL